jgi:hypothetical protein
VIKLDLTGQLLWERTYGGSGFDAAQGIAPCRDGGFIISGNSRSTDGDSPDNQGENDLWFAKIDAEGYIEWQASYGGPGLDLGFKAVEAPNRDLLLVGETASADFEGLSSKGGTDALMIRIDSGLRLRD